MATHSTAKGAKSVGVDTFEMNSTSLGSLAEEYNPFGDSARNGSLDDHEDTTASLLENKQVGRNYNPSKNWTILWIVVVVCSTICFCTVAFLYHSSLRSQCHCIEETPVYSPAREAETFYKSTFAKELNATSEYKGKGGLAQLAWNDLMRYETIVVSEETLKKINRSSVPYSDGSGYFASLDVYHQIHCVNYLRMHILFGPQDVPELSDVHIDHCIDMLRRIVMCRADIAILTFDWRPELSVEKPWPNFEVEHNCANFDSVDAWAGKNQPRPGAKLAPVS